jgi:4,5-dihydroxyphthalate decarboxylase
VHLKSVLRTLPHTADLHDGSVPIDGVTLDFVEVKPAIAAYRRMVRDVEFDMCEMAPTTYAIARAHGAPFTALPVFLTRRFHHQGLVMRADAGIRTPKDLEGKKVGVRAYSVTTGVWTRGILTNEYGLDAARVTWVVDDEEHVTQLKLPANVVHVPAGRSLADMMAAGDIDAAFTGNAGIGREGAPTPGWEARETARADYPEMFADAHDLEAEWYRRTGIYPFHNLIVVKDEILRAHPWIAKALYVAFDRAKADWLPALVSGTATSTDDKAYRDLIPVVGTDPMPYGIAANRTSIEALLQYSLQQGLIPRRLSTAELFVDPEAL